MEENKKTFTYALSLLLDQKATEAEPILRKMADEGDVEAKFTLAGLYLSGENGIVKNEKECIRLLKDAAENDNYEPAAGMLSAIYYEGLGTRKNYAESALYAKMVTDEEENDTEPWKGIVYNILGLMSMTGRGITKNIPKAWHLFKFAIGLGSQDAEANLQNLCEDYPMTEDGEIDLQPKGRVRKLTFMLFFSLLISALHAYVMRNESDLSMSYVAGGFALVCLLNILWVPYSAYGILLYFVGAIITGITTIIKVSNGDVDGIIDSPVVSGICLYGFFAFILLALMQNRKRGYAHPWNILTCKPYDGRGTREAFFSGLMQYGEGENYKTESNQTQMANILRYVVSGLLLAFNLYAAWKIANASFDFDIEWVCFKSPRLYGTLCFIGFFLQFFDWQHFSFDTVFVWKDPNSGRDRARKSDDILDVMEGQIVWPLLAHLFLVPMMYGAAIYYVLMGGFAILQGIMPWLLAALIIAAIYPVYRSIENLLHRKYRFVLIPVAGLFFFLAFAVIVTGVLSFAS